MSSGIPTPSPAGRPPWLHALEHSQWSPPTTPLPKTFQPAPPESICNCGGPPPETLVAGNDIHWCNPLQFNQILFDFAHNFASRPFCSRSIFWCPKLVLWTVAFFFCERMNFMASPGESKHARAKGGSTSIMSTSLYPLIPTIISWTKASASANDFSTKPPTTTTDLSTSSSSKFWGACFPCSPIFCCSRWLNRSSSCWRATFSAPSSSLISPMAVLNFAEKRCSISTMPYLISSRQLQIQDADRPLRRTLTPPLGTLRQQMWNKWIEPTKRSFERIRAHAMQKANKGKADYSPSASNIANGILGSGKTETTLRKSRLKAQLPSIKLLGNSIRTRAKGQNRNPKNCLTLLFRIL